MEIRLTGKGMAAQQPQEIPCRTLEWNEHSEKFTDENPPRRGEIIAIHSRGSWRAALVTKVGRVRVETVYTTESALREATRYGVQPTLTRKPVAIADARRITEVA